ncbi:Phytanoyl-CoA dioxygenase (PhyH) [Sphingomonas sp. YR710]|uniref:phytanoyl-CoA dioxygenase family protein n=1 Tax=Sphingomonas sp. YR710 TaxID=1882773 RepID=UPI00089067C6|nr:phytanoyl-CoA dioxygenase family protein [Sphingomonas sp. YR710]SDD04817.1 Phytanoyl-CoA dioxygenase (PhyH) [Sphingomonas sp. YR710]
MATVDDRQTQGTALTAYFREGEERARNLDNRGPIRLTEQGKLAPEILDSYKEHGFYILENVFDDAELAEIRAEFEGIVDHLPTSPTSSIDKHGRPALGLGLPQSPFHWSKPLGDPFGGANGMARAPVKMIEGRPAAEQPREVVFIIRGPLQLSDAALRAYAHPGLLAVTEAINGEDFVPFSEGYVVKQPGAGAAFAWHQDGMTHWDHPEWDPQIHGFNFMIQLYGSTAANGVWFVPGSHRRGKLDIHDLVTTAGGNLLPDAVPFVCNPGDVAISNRQILHGSFANTSGDLRVSLNFGFHRRSAIIGFQGKGQQGNIIYDADLVRKRSELIGYAIDARRQHFPVEKPFVYQPYAQSAELFHWNDAARADISAYYMRDLNI